MKTLIKLPLAFFVALLVLGSCTSQKQLMYLSNLDTIVQQQYFPMERPDYRIQYQDILYVNVSTMNPEMNAILNPGIGTGNTSYLFRDESSTYIYGYTVSDSGMISIPVLGEIKVYGLTMDELISSIDERAALYLVDAIVNVRLLSFKFSVIGEVTKPGTFINYNNQLTVLDAIGMAGDITDFGNRQHVLVLRPTVKGTTTYHIDLQDKNLLQSEGYFLLPNDIVIVEPIKSKPFNLNLPTMSFFFSTTLAAISTMILIISFIQQ